MDVRAKRVPWLQSRAGMRAPVPAAAARVRDTVHRLHAAAVLHLAAGRLLPQARSALDTVPHLQSACARILCARVHEDHTATSIRVRKHPLSARMCMRTMHNLGRYYAQCRPYNPKPDAQPERTLPTAAAFAACQDTDAWQCPRTWLPQPPPAPPAAPPAPPTLPAPSAPPAPPAHPPVLAAPAQPRPAPSAEPSAPATPSTTVASASPSTIAASSPNIAATLSVLAVACLCFAGVLLFYRTCRRRRRDVGGGADAAAEPSEGLECARESPWPIQPMGSKVRSFTILGDLD